MVLNWKPGQSTIRPEEIDYTSSSTTIYLYRNISKKEIEGHISYDYEVVKLTPAEFAVYSAAKSNEELLTIMEAIADLYEVTAM